MISVKPLPSVVLTLFAAFALGCASNSVAGDTDSAGQTPGNTTGTTSPATGSQGADWAAIEKLEGEAKAIAIATGCGTADACRSAPVGSRACGGPRYYIPYCPVSTDSAALYGKLDQVASAERAYNAKYQQVSTCEMRLPPDLTLAGGACTAK